MTSPSRRRFKPCPRHHKILLDAGETLSLAQSLKADFFQYSVGADVGFFKKIEAHMVAPNAEINLQLDSQYAVLGDNLEGTLTISPREDIQAMEIRCEIECAETARVTRPVYDAAFKRTVMQQVTENRCLYSAKPTCSPATELINGLTRAFRFSINIPAGGRATFMSADDTVVWKIKGIVAVHGRPDVTTKPLEVQVIPQSERPTSESPKIRFIPCDYCQTQMPEDTLVCPNCGARRKAQ
ncbi:MAG: hypothetical protein ACXWM2_05500 [Parachlamydiaceae bacterium]